MIGFLWRNIGAHRMEVEPVPSDGCTCHKSGRDRRWLPPRLSVPVYAQVTDPQTAGIPPAGLGPIALVVGAASIECFGTS